MRRDFAAGEVIIKTGTTAEELFILTSGSVEVRLELEGEAAGAFPVDGLEGERGYLLLREILDGRVSDIQAAGFIVALRTKGETEHELAALVRTMHEFATHVPVAPGAIDTMRAPLGRAASSSACAITTNQSVCQAWNKRIRGP